MPARCAFELLWLAIALALFGACRDQGGTFAPRAPDAGRGTPTPCTTTDECMGRGICMGGICESVTSCDTDSDCARDMKVCHTRRKYCVQCDGAHPGECASGQTCQFDFTCVTIGVQPQPDGGTADSSMIRMDASAPACSGTCTDRTTCPSDQSCTNGRCCTPPARCFTTADCPSIRPECNTTTGECFGGGGCSSDPECETRPGCSGSACTCDRSAGTPGVCRVRMNECVSDADCRLNGVYVHKFCTLQSPPFRCLMAPTCTTDAQCTSMGLICDRTVGSPSMGDCVNGRPCPTGTECNPATEACVSRVCVRRNCINTPSMCMPTERCDGATGMCIPMQTGACTTDAHCPSTPQEYYCDTSRSPSVCTLGCRNSTSCPGGVCDAQHRCQSPMGGVCGPCTQDADCPRGTRCLVGFDDKCHETCNPFGSGMMCGMRPGSMCILVTCSCLF